MKTELDPLKIEQVKDFLLGTCNSEHDAAEYCDTDSNEDILDYIIESKIECCATCGWWIDEEEQNEINGEIICNDCNEE
jgi:formylmethanofuran dehydrogenase subunit E